VPAPIDPLSSSSDSDSEDVDATSSASWADSSDSEMEVPAPIEPLSGNDDVPDPEDVMGWGDDEDMRRAWVCDRLLFCACSEIPFAVFRVRYVIFSDAS